MRDLCRINGHESNRSADRTSTRVHRHVRLLAVALLLSAPLLSVGCGPPPQVLGDEECFKTVDALWTAVTARSEDLLDNTTANLDRLHGEGKLSDESHAALNAIADRARAGDWEPAAKELKAFIRGQKKPQ